MANNACNVNANNEDHQQQQGNNNQASSRADDHVYDLYAVCNHHGNGLVGGHYTGKSNLL